MIDDKDFEETLLYELDEEDWKYLLHHIKNPTQVNKKLKEALFKYYENKRCE